jgi:hypothetical protein
MVAVADLEKEIKAIILSIQYVHYKFQLTKVLCEQKTMSLVTY